MLLPSFVAVLTKNLTLKFGGSVMAKLWEMEGYLHQRKFCYVAAPDNWTQKDVETHYKNNGAMGQFSEDMDNAEWEWGDAIERVDLIEEDADEDLTHLETMDTQSILEAMRILKLTAQNVRDDYINANGPTQQELSDSYGQMLKNIASVEGELQRQIDQLEDEE